MWRIEAAGKVLLSWAAAGVVGTVATYALIGTVPPSDVRNAVLLWIWPLLIVCATAVAIRWLGSPVQNAARSALTEAIVAGRKLRARIITAGVDDAEGTVRDAWKVRVDDWNAEADQVVDRVAPDRLTAFQSDPLYASGTMKDVPDWVSGLLIDLDVRIDRLVVIRASL